MKAVTISGMLSSPVGGRAVPVDDRRVAPDDPGRLPLRDLRRDLLDRQPGHRRDGVVGQVRVALEQFQDLPHAPTLCDGSGRARAGSLRGNGWSRTGDNRPGAGSGRRSGPYGRVACRHPRRIRAAASRRAPDAGVRPTAARRPSRPVPRRQYPGNQYPGSQYPAASTPPATSTRRGSTRRAPVPGRAVPASSTPAASTRRAPTPAAAEPCVAPPRTRSWRRRSPTGGPRSSACSSEAGSRCCSSSSPPSCRGSSSPRW